MSESDAAFIARRAVKQGGYACAAIYYGNTTRTWYVVLNRRNGDIVRVYDVGEYRPEWWGN